MPDVNTATGASATFTAAAAANSAPTRTGNGDLGQQGLSTTHVTDVVQLDREPVRAYRPDHPMADEEGFVYESVVNPDEEMVEMVEASRQYQNVLETVSTLRTLMARTVMMGQG